MGFVFIISSLVMLYRDYYMFGDLNIVGLFYWLWCLLCNIFNYQS